MSGYAQQWAQDPGQQHQTVPQTPEKIISSQKLLELVQQIDPHEKLDPEVEELLQEIAEDFIENVTSFACSLAKHRKSETLETKDMQLHLERNWNIFIPGYRAEQNVATRRPAPPREHLRRLEIVKKANSQTKR